MPLLAVIALILFGANLGGYDLWPPDEPRFGEVAREMLRTGDLISLHINDEPYREKPPLLFWLISLASLPGGDVTSWTARAPSAVCGLLTVMLTFLLARRLYGGRVAWWSSMVLTTFTLFWWEARSVRTDMVLTAATTGMLYSFWRFHEEKRTTWLAAFYGAMAVALLAKGPPALVFPLLTLMVFYWGRREDRRRTRWIVGTVVALVPVLVWFVLSSRAAAAAAAPASSLESVTMGDNLFRQIIGRFFLGVSKAQWPWYYLEVLPLDLFPWTIFLPWTLLWTWRNRREGEPMRFLLAWAVPAFIFFSISIGKRAVYLLPIYPVLAILVARSVLNLMDGDRANWRRNTALTWAVLLGLCAVAPWLIRFTDYRDTWRWTFILPSATAALFALDTLRRSFLRGPRDLHRLVAGHFAVLAVLGAFIALPALNEHKSAKPFTAPLRELSRAGVDYRLYSVGFSREEYVLYAEHYHVPILTDLLPLRLPTTLGDMEMAKLQRNLKKDMVDAAAEVAVADFRAVTDAELAELNAALEIALAEAHVAPEVANAFRDALRDAVAEFTVQFEAPGPAFFFVQEEDWRWLLPLHPHLRDYPVVDRRNVGSRSVLLIANRPGLIP